MTAMTNEQELASRNYHEMTEWLQSALGSSLLSAEAEILEHMINRRFGYHLLQMSCADVTIFEDSPIGHKFCLRPDLDAREGGVVAQAEAIPLAAESVDMVLLHHVLDYSSHPHHLLREADRVLISGGDLLIIGFNPFSTWGIRHKLNRRKDKAPWKASLLTSMRLCDWLKLLDFQIDQVQYGLYSMPINHPAFIKYSSLLGKLAQRLNWPTGAIYVISARKQSLSMTPIREPWKAMPRPVKGLALGDSARLAPSNSQKFTLH
jgi:SAM-dependent methyltransferase